MKILPPIVFDRKIKQEPVQKTPLQTRGGALRNILKVKTDRIIKKRKK
tara:strand:+ start:48 stop:191 length:144 start_codon:yes stop_codon:yes gene_type:complete